MSAAASAGRRRIAPGPLAAVLALLLALEVVLAVRSGAAGTLELASMARGAAAAFGIGEPLAGTAQAFVELRLWRALTAAGVGAALALSGALLQGLFRNGLASPSLIGVSAGAALGAAVAILAVGGYGWGLHALQRAGTAPVLVTLGGFAGALATGFLVLALAQTGGRISVPTLLLVGIAVNTCVAGILAAIQALTLGEDQIVRALLSWTFGTLEDRAPYHAAMAWGGTALALLAYPLVAAELDLFAGGEEDALALGVRVSFVKVAALVAAALSAASAVAVAGQIAFVGLIVPHLVRLVAGPSHRSLLPLSLLAGGCFLLGADLVQRMLPVRYALQPGVVMSLLGGPFFLVLLVRNRSLVRGW